MHKGVGIGDYALKIPPSHQLAQARLLYLFDNQVPNLLLAVLVIQQIMIQNQSLEPVVVTGFQEPLHGLRVTVLAHHEQQGVVNVVIAHALDVVHRVLAEIADHLVVQIQGLKELIIRHQNLFVLLGGVLGHSPDDSILLTTPLILRLRGPTVPELCHALGENNIHLSEVPLFAVDVCNYIIPTILLPAPVHEVELIDHALGEGTADAELAGNVVLADVSGPDLGHLRTNKPRTIEPVELHVQRPGLDDVILVPTLLYDEIHIHGFRLAVVGDHAEPGLRAFLRGA